MNIILFANDIVGLRVSQYLKSRNENIELLVLHEPQKQKYTSEIIESLGLTDKKIIAPPNLKDPSLIETIKKANPEIMICAYWGYILPDELFTIPKFGCINLHPGLLPFNRGKNPNVWPIVEGTPAGVTIHYIDAGIDTGNIIAQREVPVEITDTGKSLYEKLISALCEIFIESWPDIKKGTNKRFKQELSNGTFHLSKDLKKLDEIKLNKNYKALDLINILRARTFKPYPSAWFNYQGKKIYLRVYLEYEED